MEKINKIYIDPANPGSFSSDQALIKAVQEKYPEITRKEILDFLERKTTVTLFKQARKKFKRSKTIPSGFLTGFFSVFKFSGIFPI